MIYCSNNILHVVNIYFVLPYFIGGQFKYFSDRGYKMHVICSNSKYLCDYANKQGFNYVETSINRSLSIRQDIISVYRICKFIKKKEIGIVVGHTPKGGLLAMISGFIMRVPNRIYFRHGLVYETSHGIKRFILMNVDRLASLCATKIVCVSPSVLKLSIRDRLAALNKQIVLGKGTCSGIDTQNKFNPQIINEGKLQILMQKWGICESDWVIGYTGRLVKDKGIIELVKAFDILKVRDKSYKLLLVGMFEERDALPIQVQEKIKNDPQIVWTDFINEDQEYFYAMMNVYVLMSYREGFPTGVLEAQSMGKPVITTKVTGCCDSILDNVTGIFVDNNATDLVQKINYIKIGNNEVSMGRKARNWVVTNFDNIEIWKEIEKLY